MEELEARQAIMNLLGVEVLVCGKDDPRLCKTSVPLAGLDPILLSELTVDECHTKRVLYGTLRVDAMKLGQNVVTVIVDDAGNSAKMMVQNVTCSTSSNEEAKKLYGKGIRVAVKEPCFESGRLLEDTDLYINVQSAAHIEIVTSFPERLAALQAMDAHMLRNEGNREFANQNYVAAIELYTMSIKQASNDEGALLLAYSNRSECYLKLSKFHIAVADADKALAVDSNHVKSLYRRGRGLIGLQEYELAVGNLQLAFVQQPEDTILGALLAQARVFNQQSQDGIYNLSSYFLSGYRNEDAPELSEYVGSVEIRMTRDGQSRGLFATKDVKAGELLLVCNATGLVNGFGANELLDSACKTIKSAIDSPKRLQQLKLLAEQFQLVDGGGRGDVSISLFRPNGHFNYDEAHDTQVNVDQIFDVDRLSRKRRVSDEFGHWTLPDFMNHSCMGNVSDIRVGGAKIFRANRDIAAAEELTYCYVNSCTPWAFRQKEILTGTCSCKRCILEQSLQGPLQSINEEFGMVGGNVNLVQDPRKLSRLAIELEKRLKDLALNGEEVQWLRAAYARLYVAYYNQTIGLERMPPKEALVQAVLHSAPGSFVSVAILAKLGVWKPLSNDTMFSLVKQAFHVRYGVQEASVISAIIEQIATGAGEAALLRRDPLNTAAPF